METTRTNNFYVDEVARQLRSAADELEARATELRKFADMVGALPETEPGVVGDVVGNSTFIANVARMSDVVGHGARSANSSVTMAVGQAALAVLS